MIARRVEMQRARHGTRLPSVTFSGSAGGWRLHRAAAFRFAAVLEEALAVANSKWVVTIDDVGGCDARVSLELMHDTDAEAAAALGLLQQLAGK